jgi:hypothetical protein
VDGTLGHDRLQPIRRWQGHDCERFRVFVAGNAAQARLSALRCLSGLAGSAGRIGSDGVPRRDVPRYATTGRPHDCRDRLIWGEAEAGGSGSESEGADRRRDVVSPA